MVTMIDHHHHNRYYNHDDYVKYDDNDDNFAEQGTPASAYVGWGTLPSPSQPWHVSIENE